MNEKDATKARWDKALRETPITEDFEVEEMLFKAWQAWESGDFTTSNSLMDEVEKKFPEQKVV